MRNPLKNTYFVSAYSVSQKKGAARKNEHFVNMIISFWFWQQITPVIINNTQGYMAKLVEENHKDVKVKELVVVSFNRV